MSIEDYFGEWLKVIDTAELTRIVSTIKNIYSTTSCEPAYSDIFKVFHVTPYRKLCQVWLLQDPYPQRGVATGIALGNSKEISEDKLSPSLNIVKEAAINLEIPHNCITFDQSLEEWCKQGILLLNTALTVETNKVGSHCAIWRPFMSKLLKNLSVYQPGMIYVLWGNQAKSYKPYITNSNYIIELNHPSWYARAHKKLSSELFYYLNYLTKREFDRTVNYFNELNYE